MVKQITSFSYILVFFIFFCFTVILHQLQENYMIVKYNLSFAFGDLD